MNQERTVKSPCPPKVLAPRRPASKSSTPPARRRSVRMGRSFVLLVLAFCCALPTCAAAASAKVGHAGRFFTDGSGRVVVMHGTNMVDKLPPYYPSATGFGASDAAFLQRIGFTAVRVGVIWKALEPQPGVYDDAYLNHIEATVQTLGKHGIVSILDFHQDQMNEQFGGEGFPDWAVQTDGLTNTKAPFPGGYETNPALQRAFENFWADKAGPNGIGLQEYFAAAWKHVAQRFVGNPNVLGYEVINEPFPGSDYLQCIASSGCAASDAQLTGLEGKVDAAIRSVDSRTLVFYEPYVTFNFGYQDHVAAPADPRTVFAWHDYCLTTSPCSANATDFQNAAAHITSNHEAEFLTEFGATTQASELETIVTDADQNMVSWTEWAYCACGDPTGSSTEGIVVNPRKPKSGSNLISATLNSIVEPYPHIIAGTPSSWSYQRQTHTFKFTYSPRKASGRGKFPTGSITQIEAPALDYPRGYAARITGAAIVSARNSPVLEVASCHAATRITVTITRGRHSIGSCRVTSKHHA
jgi:endoglycosylceramidase